MSRVRDVIRDYRSVNRALDRVILPVIVESGLTMAQFKALLAAGSDTEQAITIGALACDLGIAQSTASLLVDRLEASGLVHRAQDPTDRRRVLVRPTARGEELVAELRLGRRQTFEGWIGGMPDEDLAALARGLRALAAAATEERRIHAGRTGSSPAGDTD